MTDDDSRTVAGVAHLTTGQARKLGVDPDMPYDQFRRRLEMGERAEKCHKASAGTSVIVDADVVVTAARLLDHIRGDGG